MSGFSGSSPVVVLGQSAVAAAHTGDTVATTLATIAIPANAMGANGSIEIVASFSFTSSANSKTLAIKFAGTSLFSTVQTTPTAADIVIRLGNRGSAGSQRSAGSVVSTGGGAVLVANPAAIDTTQSQNITITGQLALGTETVTLESYQVVLYPKS